MLDKKAKYVYRDRRENIIAIFIYYYDDDDEEDETDDDEVSTVCNV